MNKLLKVGSAVVLSLGAVGGYLYYRGGLDKLFGETDNTKDEVKNRNTNNNGRMPFEEQKSKAMDMAGSKRIPADHPLVNQAFQNGNR